MKRFEMNGISYTTDTETLKLLRTVVPRAKKFKDFSAVIAIMALGLKTGRIKDEGPIKGTIENSVEQQPLE